MRITMILALVIAILSAIFAIQNATPVTVNIYGFTAESSLAVVLMVTFAAGVITSLLVSIPAVYIRERKKQRQQANKPTGESDNRSPEPQVEPEADDPNPPSDPTT
jgi:putative membrane protein